MGLAQNNHLLLPNGMKGRVLKRSTIAQLPNLRFLCYNEMAMGIVKKFIPKAIAAFHERPALRDSH